ncbi:ty3-gypsy retroelement transposase [Cucumis melo var. makuwa]|uniref:Ty3-gypsy retroelement transposase n=1 Tax=Cucumis melo var. makuwa TaxID=1194695 RepID=A0A5A7TW32_CUCMM|nr:ty3-gypsy retroelement transposase [Cucumis melo var. makuwa]TYK08338.1 ty3-gypsy retroelement transposase [Cucumis melo var. makuwa]
MPVIEASLSEIAKNFELMRLQSEKQQQKLLMLMESTAEERSMMSERLTKSTIRDSATAKGKENEATSSRVIETDRNIGDSQNEKKTDNNENATNRNKFKKVEMHVFNGEDPNSWPFRVERFLQIKQKTTVEEYRNLFDKLVAPLSDLQERVVEETFMNGLFPWIKAEVAFCRPKGLAEMMKIAQVVENREIIKGEANLSGFSGGKYAPQASVSAKTGASYATRENKGNTTFPIRTITLRSSNSGEVHKEAHNFVSEKLVKKLQLPTKETEHYGVILGSGTVIQGKGICEALEGKQVCIKGDPSLTKARVSLKSMMIKSWGEQDEGFLIECRALEVKGLIRTECCKADVNPKVVNPVLSILDQFTDVFEWPDKLPPRRDIEHQIHLKKGTDPINVRPYQYGYHQKEEMEKLVKEMLALGASINAIFKPHMRKFVSVFFDDILIYSKNVDEHVNHMELVLSILRKHELYANKKKCSFVQSKVEYLGHVISGEGVWFHSSTLNSVAEEGGFKWNEEGEEAFEKLKQAMMSLPVLALPNFSQTFEIETDASDYGIDGSCFGFPTMETILVGGKFLLLDSVIVEERKKSHTFHTCEAKRSLSS